MNIIKSTILILIAVIATAIPSARAFDRNPWDAPTETLRDLVARMDNVVALRDKWGASPRVTEEIETLHLGIKDLDGRVKHHAGDPMVARKKADDLTDLMSDVEAQYRAHAHHVRDAVNHGW